MPWIDPQTSLDRGQPISDNPLLLVLVLLLPSGSKHIRPGLEGSGTKFKGGRVKSESSPVWTVAPLVSTLLLVLVPGCRDQQESRGEQDQQVVPVEVALIELGFIEDLRSYSGTIESTARFIVAPKISGRIQRLAVDIADPVKRGQVVATLDVDEHLQAVAQDEANLKVAQANRDEAVSAVEIAERDLDRIRTLHERGVASDADFDTARAESVARRAAVKVAEARVARDEAALAAARIRLGYTSITADWYEGAEERVVAARFADEGGTVAANTPLLSIVQLDPVKAVFFVTEREYGKLSAGQPATLTTDAWPGESFPATVARVAPVFQEETRQARVELTVDNVDRRLKPGMFVKATVSLEQAENAVIVPVSALTIRDEQSGVFVVSGDGSRVAWLPVHTGIQQDGRVQLLGAAVTGRVVTLGQQLVDEGSLISIIDAKPATLDAGNAPGAK